MEAHLPRDKSHRDGSSFEAPPAAVAVPYNEALVHQTRQSRRCVIGRSCTNKLKLRSMYELPVDESAVFLCGVQVSGSGSNYVTSGDPILRLRTRYMSS